MSFQLASQRCAGALSCDSRMLDEGCWLERHKGGGLEFFDFSRVCIYHMSNVYKIYYVHLCSIQ